MVPSVIIAVLVGGQLLASAGSEPAAPAPVVLVADGSGIGVGKAEVRLTARTIARLLCDLGVIARAREERRPIAPACLTRTECVGGVLEAAGAAALLTVELTRVGTLASVRLQLWSETGRLMEEVVTAGTDGLGASPAMRQALERLAAAVITMAQPPITAIPTPPPALTEPITALVSTPAPAPPSRAGSWLLVGGGLLAVGGIVLVSFAARDTAAVESIRVGTRWRDVEGAYRRAPIEWATGVAALGGAAVASTLGIVLSLRSPNAEPVQVTMGPASVSARF